MYLLVESFMNGTVTTSQEFKLVNEDNFEKAVKTVKSLLFDYSKNKMYNNEVEITSKEGDHERLCYYLKTEGSLFYVSGRMENRHVEVL